MTRHNADNERLKRRYFAYLKEAKRYSDSSVDAVAAAIYRFECFTRFREFKAFHIEQAVAFKNDLASGTNSRSGEPLSKSTLYATLNALRGFFVWLAGQPGFRSRLSYSDAEYFNLSQRDSRVAKARREVPFPSLEQIAHVLDCMPDGTSIERRNRALVAGERVCRNPEEFKAWSQNLGHEHVSTTFSSYRAVGPARQAEIIKRLRTHRTRGSGTDVTGVHEAALAAARTAEANDRPLS